MSGRLSASELNASLRRDVHRLAGEIGERNVAHPEAYAAAAGFIEESFRQAGYEPSRQTFASGVNVEAEVRGGDEILVVGAHYDSVLGSPGADDNASGVAAMLAIARALHGVKAKRSIRFVAFANEEPPHFGTPAMGSWQAAKRCHDRGEKIAGMLSLESIGYFSDASRSQTYPAMLEFFYPRTANFIALVSNLRSRKLLSRCVRAYRGAAAVPCEKGALPASVPGIGWSDQWAFWQFGVPAIMVTDTAPFRNPHYHTPSDRPDTLDYERLGRVVEGLIAVVEDLSSP